VHGDLHYNNVIVHDGRIVGVIDWETACYTTWENAKKDHQDFFGSEYSDRNEHIWAGVYNEMDVDGIEEAQ